MVLEDLKTMNDKNFWEEALPKLTKYFDGIMFDQSCPVLRIGRSVTEWEVNAVNYACQHILLFIAAFNDVRR